MRRPRIAIVADMLINGDFSKRVVIRPGDIEWAQSPMPGVERKMLDRIIKASSNKGDIVLDPFNGSGTTVVSAALLDRKYVGIDQSEEYVAHARKRLAHALSDKNGVPDSRILTATDAFGRPRVARRGRAVKSA